MKDNTFQIQLKLGDGLVSKALKTALHDLIEQSNSKRENEFIIEVKQASDAKLSCDYLITDDPVFLRENLRTSKTQYIINYEPALTGESKGTETLGLLQVKKIRIPNKEGVRAQAKLVINEIKKISLERFLVNSIFTHCVNQWKIEQHSLVRSESILVLLQKNLLNHLDKVISGNKISSDPITIDVSEMMHTMVQAANEKSKIIDRNNIDETRVVEIHRNHKEEKIESKDLVYLCIIFLTIYYLSYKHSTRGGRPIKFEAKYPAKGIKTLIFSFYLPAEAIKSLGDEKSFVARLKKFANVIGMTEIKNTEDNWVVLSLDMFSKEKS